MFQNSFKTLYHATGTRSRLNESLNMFQLSFNLDLVVGALKRAVHWPIPKIRTLSAQVIRPISLLPQLAKVIEKVVLPSIKCDLLGHYDTNQFRFLPNSSTQCALISLYNQATIYLNDHLTFGVLIASHDYSKAFNQLRFDLMIIKRLIDCNLSCCLDVRLLKE